MQLSLSRSRSGARGFTLTELMVVIGIIVVLIGITAPMLISVWGKSERAAAKSNLQAISTALAMYKQDFGDVPRLSKDWPGDGTSGSDRNMGAALLGWALVGPGQNLGVATPPSASDPAVVYKPGMWYLQGSTFTLVVSPAPSMVTEDMPVGLILDGHDGPGIGGKGGRVFGPYLQTGDQIKVGDVTKYGPVLLDVNNMPVLYYAAAVKKPDITKQGSGGRANGYISDYSSSANSKTALWDSNDNLDFFRWTGTDTQTLAYNRFAVMMGDRNRNGYIDNGETAKAIDKEYILWMAGPDQTYGPETIPTDAVELEKAIEDCDDVTSFIAE